MNRHDVAFPEECAGLHRLETVVNLEKSRPPALPRRRFPGVPRFVRRNWVPLWRGIGRKRPLIRLLRQTIKDGPLVPRGELAGNRGDLKAGPLPDRNPTALSFVCRVG